MKNLILLYWGSVFLMYLSQVYYPVKNHLQGRQIGRYHFLREKSDIFMATAIFWLSAFSFLRTSYNDSPLSSKRQKNLCNAAPCYGCRFLTLLVGLLIKNKSKTQRFCPYYFDTG